MQADTEMDDAVASQEPAAANEAHPGADTIQRQRLLVRELIELVAKCVSQEPKIERDFEEGNRDSEHHFDTAYQTAIGRFALAKDSAENEIQEARRKITDRYQVSKRTAEREFSLTRRRIIEQYTEARDAAKAEYQETRWTAAAVQEGTKVAAENAHKEAEEQIDNYANRCRSLREETQDFLRACWLRLEPAVDSNPAGATMADLDPFELIRQQLELAEHRLAELRSLKITGCLRGGKPLWMLLALWLLLIYPSLLLAGLLKLSWVYGLGGSGAATILIGVGAVGFLYSFAKARVANVAQPLFLAVARAEGLLDSCREEAAARYHQQVGEATRKYKEELRQASEKYRKRREELKQERIDGIRQISEKYRSQRTAARERRAQDWSAAASTYRERRTAIQKEFDGLSHRLHDTLERQLSENKVRYDACLEELDRDWHDGLARTRVQAAEIDAECRRLFPDWSDPAWERWRPASAIPPYLRFGELRITMAEILEGIPSSSRLRARTQDKFTLPALMPFPRFCSMLLKARDEGRAIATQLFQTAMLRLLCALPPAKLRFTIIDPVGLGRNFASFMHLADYDEALVNSRIWTEASHIDQKLADLTEHMETVIQKYLRDQFPTIEEYNVHAQEVAEPYRFLVVANFPVNFSADAVRRLISIIQSGPRCGVYTLISVDMSQPMPAGFSLSDLQQAGAICLEWHDGRFKWDDDEFAEFALELDTPPGADFSANLLRRIGEKAKEAKRVEVPFEFVAPAPGRWWSASSKLGIDVPLGRVGATKKQHLRLGQGTSQHVLIAGKTGSGKSTFLHALVSNLALHYSPQEIELYLVDFKKGVEFKTYANHELPHARVIAVESEREFGLSVLQRLDGELKRRAELFRSAGAQELAAYRQSNGAAAMPRILLMVDEFQEFFVEDDKIAQEAALLLDRLVRQGRAFGLHVLLGSQTLGGAYTLARSTVDQMAVRIALQCSETDAHLILSHDNSAARLLSRPGEAIYNDANGLVEGNNPFQIVWLSEERREFYLEKIQELASQAPAPAEPQIVFEGNAAADVRKNFQLSQLLASPPPSIDPPSLVAWLGEAIAIKDPTAAVFTRQSGNNLLIVGQNEQAALGIISTAFISLAASLPSRIETQNDSDVQARFYILDGSPEAAPHAGHLAKLTSMPGSGCKFGGRREAPSFVAELAAETNRRVNENPREPPALFLLIYGLHRFRDLRRDEDDFGFSGQGADKQSPASQFAEILREGSAVGIHTLVWCDSLNSLNRTLDRQSLREFELRVLFQMSASDSSTLIDSPLASKLGVHRAFYSSEEQGKLEKFRPYGVPDEEWLDLVRRQLEDRGH